MGIEIKESNPGENLDDFLKVPHLLLKDDSAWIPPLDFEVRERLTPKKNPFFEHGEARLFTAWKDGQLVGRISAQIDREHLRIHQDEKGFFGFFDTIDDEEVSNLLLAKAEAWLKSKGMKKMSGPFSLSINEESGLLVKGFEYPPVLMNPHSTRYQGELAEKYGLEKEKDLFGWLSEAQETPKRAQKAWDMIDALPDVRFRSVDTKRMASELDIILEIFNDAWKDNWGFIPATESEAKQMADLFKFIIDPDIAFIAEVKGKPVAIVIALPNLNEAMEGLDGKLLPFGWAKLLWRIKVKGLKSARLIMLGIKEEIRGVKRYGALSTALYAEFSRRGRAAGYEWAELGWTLEDNKPINLGIRVMGGRHYKTYRVYHKTIA